MSEMDISEVARRAGIRPSALRYYEDMGLITSSRRIGGRRQYDAGVLQRLALIQTGQQAGFTLAELGLLINHVLDSDSSGGEWRTLVERKLSEMDIRMRNIQNMSQLLNDMIDCEGDNLAECIVLTGQRHQQP